MLNHKQYLELASKMVQWAEQYYKLGIPTISDQQWDMHYREMQEYEQLHPKKAVEHSVVNKVGYAMFGEAGSVRHSPPMLSLSNAMNVAEALKRIAKFNDEGIKDFYAELKADGNAARITYKGGKAVRATTRGDGISGEDISAIITKGAKGVLPTIAETQDFSVDGEIVIKWVDFDVLNDLRERDGKSRYSNPRNAVAGILTSKEPALYEINNLSFIAYGITDVNKAYAHYSQYRDKIVQLGFEVVGGVPFSVAGEFPEIESKYAGAREDLPYMIDGIVVKVSDIAAREKYGENAHSPMWAFSYKFPAMAKWTNLNATGFTVGRTGQITGMLYFDPVDLGGVTVVKSAVDSYPRWKDMMPAIGDKVLVSRRADVRPYIEDVKHAGLSLGTPFTPTCPSCLHMVKVIGKKVYCTNHLCSGVAIAALTYAFDKEILNVPNFSEATAAHLVYNGVGIFTELFMLEAGALEKKKFVSSTAQRIVQAVDNARKTNMWRVIAALGIPTVGRTYGQEIASWIIANHGNTVQALVSVLSDPKLIAQLPVGNAAKAYIEQMWDNPIFEANVKNLADCGFDFIDAGPLTGKRYCITGAFTGKLKRAVVAQWLKELGATVQDSVTADTTALITDDPISEKHGSTKMKKAIKLGVQVMPSVSIIEVIERHTL